MLSRSILAATIGAAISGCAAPPVQVDIDAPFDANEARRLTSPGVNAIKGSGLMRQVGGGTVTCAGRDVLLVPATAYAKRRFDAIYGPDASRGYQPASRRYVFSPEPPEYRALTHRTTCDAQGFFAFDKVADGDFYAVTLIVWQVGPNQQGGAMMRRVKVFGGEIANVVLAP